MDITIEDESDGIHAYADGREVGYFDIREVDEEHGVSYIAYRISVDDSMQRRGIATKMVERAVEVYGVFQLPSLIPQFTSKGQDSCDHFTSDGQGLFQHCLNLGIITEDYFATYPK